MAPWNGPKDKYVWYIRNMLRSSGSHLCTDAMRPKTGVYVAEVAVDPTHAGLVGERGPDDKQAFVVAFFRRSSSSTPANRRQRRSAADDPDGATSSNDQRQARRRRRYRANDRPGTAWSYHGLYKSLHTVKNIRIFTYILCAASFPFILTEPVPYTFASVNRRNNEARVHIVMYVGSGLHYSVDLRIQTEPVPLK